MKISQYYPVLMTNTPAKLSAFYQEHFGFAVRFESDWYVHLQSPENPGVNLALLDGQHQTIPESARAKAVGVILNFEVPNVDEVHERLTARGLPVLHSLRDEAFGQRHFITSDPDGTLIDIITPIPPSPEFLAQYDADALPEGAEAK